MLLAQTNPTAASALCQALKRSINDDRIWVYYRTAPLLPILRQSDVRQAGCALQLPPQRLQTAPPDQALWIASGRLLERMLTVGGPPPAPAETRDLLAALARNDFSSMRENPPLLYHNDFTASVSRFYWSEEFGYALWLRIYFESMRHSSPGACGGQPKPSTCGLN
jgi:hypothetical protein